MWGIVALAWTAVAVVVAGAHHRLRRLERRVPAELRLFVARFRRALRERHPDVDWRGFARARDTVILEVAGQDTPVPLGPLFRHFQAFPDRFGEIVDRLVQEIRAEGLDHTEDHEFGDVAADILPQVRPREWVRSVAPAFGDSALVCREFGPDLAICYVIDDDWSMVFVCEHHLKRWRRTEEDLFHLSTNNLHRRAGAVPIPEPGEEPVKVRTGDGYDAARVLLLDPVAAEGTLVAIPERDVLLLADGDAADLAELTQLNEQQAASSAHAISPELYRLEDGQLRRLTDGGAEP